MVSKSHNASHRCTDTYTSVSVLFGILVGLSDEQLCSDWRSKLQHMIFVIAQSKAILRYASKKAHTYPKDPRQSSISGVIFTQMKSIKSNMVKLKKNKKNHQKKLKSIVELLKATKEYQQRVSAIRRFKTPVRACSQNTALKRALQDSLVTERPQMVGVHGTLFDIS